jgi:Ca2+-binding RTX toxin-like protein
MGIFTTGTGQTLRMDRMEVGVPQGGGAGRTGELVVNGDGSVSLIITDVATGLPSYRVDSTGPLMTLPPTAPIDETGNHALGDITGNFLFYDHAVSTTVPVGTLTGHVWRDVHLAVFPGPTYRLDLTVETLGALFPFFMGDDTITTGDGNDVVNDYGGNLTASLGDGDDTLFLAEAAGATTTKFVDAGAGDDQIQYQGGNGSILGGTGDDAIGGAGGQDGVWLLNGGLGRDTIDAYQDSRIVDNNNSGNDRYTGVLGGGDVGPGVMLSYAAGTLGITVDLMLGRVSGGGHGVDQIVQINTIEGTQGADAMLGASFGLLTQTLGSRFWGLGGNDTLTGDTAGDLLDGGTGDDSLSGGTGDDTLLGGTGIDVLTGGDGNDVLTAGPGTDTLTGGAGRDTLTGGAGDDVFVFLLTSDSTTSGTGRDRINGFEAARDVIDLSAIDALTGTPEDDALVLIGSSNFTARGQVQVRQEGGLTVVRIDNAGSLTPDMRIDIAGLHVLTEDNFVF